MNARRPLLIPLYAALFLWAAACDWPWPLDDPLDPFRCDPPCEGKDEECINGQCVVPPADAGLPYNCGDDKCEVSESIKSCPQDCEKCTGDTATCTKSKTLSGCDDGTYRTYSCDYICVEHGYGFATECRVRSGNDICVCGGGPGYAPCIPTSTQKPCGADYRCLRFPPKATGFCTKLCTTLKKKCTESPGTQFDYKCGLKTADNKFACGFYCANKTPCPPNMICSTGDVCK